MVPVVAGGVVCHDLVLQLLVPREPWYCRILVERVVFSTEFSPGAQGESVILVTGGGAAQHWYFQALKTPCSCRESVLCA